MVRAEEELATVDRAVLAVLKQVRARQARVLVRYSWSVTERRGGRSDCSGAGYRARYSLFLGVAVDYAGEILALRFRVIARR